MGLDIYVHSLVGNSAKLGMTKSLVRRTLWIWQAASCSSSQ